MILSEKTYHIERHILQGFLVILFIFPMVMACSTGVTDNQDSAIIILPTRSLTIATETGNVTYTVEVADEASEQQTGLMYRTSMASDRGMLFIFSKEDQHGFWMKNTYISLDMIFITAGKEVAFIAENTTPLSTDRIIPNEKVLYVLELNAGQVQSSGIKVGDIVSF